MHPIYSKVGIVSLFMILFFSVYTTAYGETCETKEDIYIQIDKVLSWSSSLPSACRVPIKREANQT